MKYLILFFALALTVANPAAAAQKSKTRKVAEPAPQVLTLAKMELGMTGVLAFPPKPGQPVTLLPLEIGDITADRFIGSLTSSLSGKVTSVVVRGVKTEGLVSGRYYQLNGLVKVVGTEDIGETVFVLEPVDPATFSLQRSDSPELARPR